MKRVSFRRISRLIPILLCAALVSCSGESPEQMLASAKDFLAKDDPRSAVIQIKNALQKNPDLPEARYLLGKALLKAGDPVAAELELRKAQSLKHSADEVLPLLGRALLAQGKANKVVEELQKSDGLGPDAIADVKTTLASALATLGKTDDAEKAMQAALAARPEHVPARLFQAGLLAARGDREGALRTVDGVLAKSPSDTGALKVRGDLLLMQGDSERAIDAYRKAIAAGPENVAAHGALIDHLFAVNKVDEAAQAIVHAKKAVPRSVFVSYHEARLAFLQKDFNKAREHIQQYLKRAPDHAPGLQLAGSIEFAVRSYPQAEAHFSKIVHRFPENLAARRLLAATYLKMGQPARALQTIEPVLGKIEKDLAMLSLTGQTYLMSGDAGRAEQYFKKAANLNPKDVSARTSLAMTHLAKGDAGALGELESIAAEDPGTRADRALIASSMRQERFDAALKAIDRLEKKMPASPDAHHLRGGALLGKRDVAAARRSLEKALEIQPSYFPSASVLAALDLADKKPDEATKRMERVLAADPKNLQAYMGLAELKVRTGGKKEDIAAVLERAVAASPTEPGPRVALIELHMRTKDPKKALSVAQEGMAAIPDRAEMVEALGRAQLVSGDTNAGLATFKKLPGLRPGTPQPFLLMAEANLAAKNRDAALQNLHKALETRSDYLPAQRRLVELLTSGGAADQAIKVAREVQAQRPKDAIGFSMEGDVRAAGKSWPEAASAYRKAMRLAPTASELALKLHSMLALGGNASEAQRFASGWIQDHPKDRTFRLYMADRAMSQKDLVGASAQYRAIIDLFPDDPIALNNLAWVAHQQKDSKALSYAEKANQLVPDNPAFMDTLAMILSARGEHNRAADLLKKAIAKAPEIPAFRLNYARVLARSGDKAAARKELDAVQQLGDKGPPKDEIELVRKEI